MPIKPVLLLGNPQLREISKEITKYDDELEQIILDLRDTLSNLQKTKNIGRALAAPQIGYKKRVIYFNLPDNDFAMINPVILFKSSDKFQVWDSCFSFDVAFFVQILRHKEIQVEFMTENGKQTHVYVEDLAELVQHEIDHLDGILATDHLTDVSQIIMREEWEARYRGD
ncbi:peptide deformylase [Candidatus Hodarchaeum mangrovi]